MNYTNRSSDRINAAIEKALAAERGGTRIDRAIEKALAAENSKSRIDRAIEKARAAENSSVISTASASTPRTSSGSSAANPTSVGRDDLDAPNNTTPVGGDALIAPETSRQTTNTKPLTGFAAGVQANNTGYMKMALEKAGLPADTYIAPAQAYQSEQPIKGFAAGVQANNEGYKALAEEKAANGKGYVNYLARKAVGGGMDFYEGAGNFFGYAQQGLAKGAEMQAANAMRSVAATTKSEAAKAALTPLAEAQQEAAVKNLKTPTETYLNFADNYIAKTEEMHADKDYGFVGQLGGDVAQGLGGEVAKLPFRVFKGVGEVVLFISSFGNAMQSAKKEGKSDAEALPYAFATASVELITEKMLGFADFTGKGGFDDAIEEGIKKISSNPMVQKSLRTIAGGVGEGFEEFIAGVSDAYVNKLTIKTDKRTFGEILKDSGYDALVAGITGVVVSTANVISGGEGEIIDQEQFGEIVDAITTQAAAETNAEIEAMIAAGEALNSNANADGHMPLKTILYKNNNLESGLNTAYDNIKTGELENGEEVYLREGGQWADGENTHGKIRTVEEGTGQNPSQNTKRKPADHETAALTYGKEVSAASLGIEGGSGVTNLRIVTDGDTAATKAAKQMAQEQNLQLVLFAGNNLEIVQHNGTAVSARALIDGNKVFVRADHAEFTAVQLMGHEVGHNRIARGEIDPDTVRRRIRQVFGGIKTIQLAAMYASAYEGAGMTAGEIWEEVICDSLGDMNVFAGTAKEALAAQLLSATKEASTETQTESTRGPPSDKYSRDPDERRRALRKGEMVNEFRDKVNWRRYYQKILSDEYNPDYFDDGDIAKMELDGVLLTLEIQRNGEWSVVGAKEIKHESLEQNRGENFEGNGGAQLSRKRENNSYLGNEGSVRSRGGNKRGGNAAGQAADGQGNDPSSAEVSEIKTKYSRELAEKGNNIPLAKLPADRLLYTERLLEYAKRDGNIYSQRLLQREIDKAQRDLRKQDIDSSAPMPTIYSDRIKSRKHNMLDAYDVESDNIEGVEELNADLENDANSDTIKTEDIVIGKSLGAKAKNYDIMDFETGEIYHFAEGTRIQNVEVFAGKGTKDEYRNAYKMARRYGGQISNWQHVKGFGWVSTPDGDGYAEVHWSQCEGLGKYEFFIKRWIDR